MKSTRRRCAALSAACLVCTFAIPTTGQDPGRPDLGQIDHATTPSELKTLFDRSDGAGRVAAMRALGRVAKAEYLNWDAIQFMCAGLHDSNPEVIKVSIAQVGRLKATALADTLVAIYHTADQRFGGPASSHYTTRVIKSLAMLGGGAARGLFEHELVRLTVSSTTNNILEAVGCMGDTSLLPAVTAYRERLGEWLRGIQYTPENSIRYSRPRQTYKLACDVERRLHEEEVAK